MNKCCFTDRPIILKDISVVDVLFVLEYFINQEKHAREQTTRNRASGWVKVIRKMRKPITDGSRASGQVMQSSLAGLIASWIGTREMVDWFNVADMSSGQKIDSICLRNSTTARSLSISNISFFVSHFYLNVKTADLSGSHDLLLHIVFFYFDLAMQASS